ncbi:glycoside hydrolase family 2 TIM barrel-domain containing protein [Leifsonia sp. F6_8S_P_1B]|uniref:Glycoside hydrolase family 2 TIM barrel-domain containing protein n=1 Tax=Leifsonia williamsii TaxID=3035919 RepID=A0ABT8KFX2_9MICO|nr:glycoside hydrolase family 2 TIM barrel-domain containing protein [Leifsonia williamsii]MDN4616356.1 glycoside hydrolase family 2 TIM barrel-domain containing protein [Leifsonia williamsii]
MLRTSFNDDWFVGRDQDDRRDDLGPITLPHDAMITETRSPHTPNGHNTGYYPGGIYRYTKRFIAPPEWQDQHPTLEFEGVYHRSRVFVNGVLAGGRPSGYALFHVPLGTHLRFGEENVIEVVANNDDMPNSRWYTGSGIYRPVHLLTGGPVRVLPTGLRATTLSADAEQATVAVSVAVENGTSDATEAEVVVTLNRKGREVASGRARVPVDGFGTGTATAEIGIGHPALWSPDDPNLYQVHATVTVDSAIQDEVVDSIGIRTVTVDAEHGLRINGQVTKLRGACVHHDHGILGAVTLDQAEDRRARLLKSAGFNAIRTAHNPSARALLAAADRHGLLVMEEFTDVWTRAKTTHDYATDFEEWHERDLEAMVANAYNHPSVIMYSIGNEIAETGQPSGIELNRRLVDMLRSADSTRPITNGVNPFLNLLAPSDEKHTAQLTKSAEPDDEKGSGGPSGRSLITVLNLLMSVMQKVTPIIVRRKFTDSKIREVMDMLDVAGYNYGGARYVQDAKRYPEKPIVGTETGPGQLAQNWPLVESHPQIIGDFVWTGWDYLGEAGIGTIRYNDRPRLFSPWPGHLAGTSNFDITGHRQTQTYINEIIWGLRSDPYIAVRPVDHARDKRTPSLFRATDAIRSWSWDGFEGTPATVEVYARAARVTLELDGAPVSRGRRHGDLLTTFRVPFRPGTLTARTYDEKGKEIGSDELRSADADLRLNVSANTDGFVADGQSLLYLPIELTDSAGMVKPTADRTVTVSIDGPAVLAFGSAAPSSSERFTENTHSTFQGRAMAVLRATREPGAVTVTISANGCTAVSLTQTVSLP